MRKYPLYFFVACAMAFSAPVLASTDSYYVVNATDLSLYYLNALFGHVGDILVTGSSSKVVADMFSYFNAGVFTFTMAILTYVFFMSVIETAQEGKGISERLNAWVVIRSGLGVSLLAPLPGGYCMIQIIVMWAITQGVGLANVIWSQAVYNIATAGGYAATISTNASVANAADDSSENPQSIQDIAIGTSTTSYNDTISPESQLLCYSYIGQLIVHR